MRCCFLLSSPKRKCGKLSLTQSKKYSERGQILKDPPGRLPRKVHWAPLGVWLGSWGRLSMSPTVSSEGEKNKSDNFFSSFFFRSPLGYVRKRHAYRTQLVEPVPAQVSDLKISHGKLVKKMRGARGVYARYCPYGQDRAYIDPCWPVLFLNQLPVGKF